MKKLIYLSLSLLTMALFATSCSDSSDEPNVNADKGSPATMTINFDNPETRATGVPTNESVITSGTILVFRSGTGILDGSATFTSALTPISVNITAGTRDVYVIANTGISFASVQNVADLNNRTTKYALSAISATGSNLPMSGTALNQNASLATKDLPALVTVNMQYMCSKVTIAWDVASLNPGMVGFTVTDAYVMNVPSMSDFFTVGASNNLTTYSTAFSTGCSTQSSFTTGAYYPASPYTNSYTPSLDLPSPGLANNGINYFYIFENNIAASPTIVVIQGTVTDNTQVPAVTSTYYYPIVINGRQNTLTGDGTATVVRGKHYTVSAVIMGAGNNNPYSPITNASMNVTIVSPTWTPVIIGQIFN